MGRRRTVDPQTIVAAGARVFERYGYADSTLDAIAAEAGVSKPTIYQYVASKQRLLETIVEQVIYPLREGISAIVTGDESVTSKIHAFVALHVDAACRHTAYYQVLLADQHQLSAPARRNYQAWAHEVDRETERLLRQGIEEGTVRAGIDPAVTAKLLNSMLTSIARWYRPGEGHTADSLRREVAQLLQGLIVVPDEAGADA
ncbi:TetR/AcrR family transcriptional regulator [Actinomycetospora chiangmaiensis]|uniref:TetR/AcrR family transcriptional regulator n=1 Tax=Actinomycetospora chiangmaiensis TaxID=402650 RepID=UPI0003750665|nr:TetR/AcrR family transcriptional regulator [Actinomycetospora chiangmaiensis]